MSLDFYLEYDEMRLIEGGPRIFIRRNGQTIEIDRAEWDRLYPDREPVTFSSAEESTREVFHANITHNLGAMAAKAGLYACLWRPDENGIRVASEMVNFLKDGLDKLRADPEHFLQFNPANGWGDYNGLVDFAECVLDACLKHPTAAVRVWR